jgi:ZIP family zinc transporter
VLQAALLGFVASASLILGAWLGKVAKPSTRTVGLVMGFGAGALISAVSFELVAESIDLGGAVSLTLGLAGGAITFFVADLLIDRAGGQGRKQHVGKDEGTGLAIVAGAALDGIPESIILGVSLIGGGSVSLAFLAAVLVSNLPEGVGAASSLSRAGVPTRKILLGFLAISIASGLAAAVGYLVFDSLQPRALAIVQAFAAGALLTMVMDTMAPEAFDDAGMWSGLVAVAGFELAFLLSEVG